MKVDGEKEYPFRYQFTARNAEDITSGEIQKELDGEHSIFQIETSSGAPISFENFELENIKTGSIHTYSTNAEGNKKVKLKKGTYQLRVPSLYWNEHYLDSFDLRFVIGRKENMRITLKLAGETANRYEIHSKMELQDDEILEAVDCVKNQGNGTKKGCRVEGKYFVMIQI